ncbi:MAG: factor-independent urate hydroxylase [Gemmatimonadaceae bacterium]
MSVQLAHNSYGKSAIRLFKVTRQGEQHEIRDLTVDVTLEGDFDRAHAAGDNSAVLPTDTMRNSVYALAARDTLGCPEEFAGRLGAHFLGAAASAARVTVRIAEHRWHRIVSGDASHGHAFEHGSTEARTTRVMTARDEAVDVESGLEDLVLLKSGHSGFAGYPRDRYTTLPETDDRILATSLSARWGCEDFASDHDAVFANVRRTMLETFAGHDSKSVQHTLYAMGEAVLQRCREVHDIALSMPNRHHLPFDVSRLGEFHANEIFVPTPEPYGLIEATLRRSARDR